MKGLIATSFRIKATGVFFALLLAGASVLTDSSSAARVPTCRTAQLSLRAVLYGEASQQFTQTLTFTNDSSRACALAGWPTLQLVAPVDTRTQRVITGAPNKRPYSTVLLRPTGAASFNVYGADFDAEKERACARSSAMLVNPPGDSRPRVVRVRLPDCGLYYIAPLVAGKTDHAAWTFFWNP
jgi:hypothetical protein